MQLTFWDAEWHNIAWFCFYAVKLFTVVRIMAKNSFDSMFVADVCVIEKIINSNSFKLSNPTMDNQLSILRCSHKLWQHISHERWKKTSVILAKLVNWGAANLSSKWTNIHHLLTSYMFTSSYVICLQQFNLIYSVQQLLGLRRQQLPCERNDANSWKW